MKEKKIYRRMDRLEDRIKDIGKDCWRISSWSGSGVEWCGGDEISEGDI